MIDETIDGKFSQFSHKSKLQLEEWTRIIVDEIFGWE